MIFLQLQVMREFSLGQRKTLSNFFNNLAVAWSSGAIITPTFAQVTNDEKLAFFAVGISLACFFLTISLILVKEINS
jgi:hypothetical protein